MCTKCLSLDLKIKVIKWIVVLLPMCIACMQEFVEGFAFTTIIQSRIYVTKGRIIINPFSNIKQFYAEHVNAFSFRPAPGLAVAILNLISGIEPRTLLFYPILGFMSIIFIYLLLDLIINNKPLVNIFTFTLAFSYAFIRSSLFFFYIPYGILLFILIVYIVCKCYLFKKILNLRELIMSFIIFLSSLLSYYSSSALIIILIFSLIVIDTLLSSLRNKSHEFRSQLYSFTFALLIAYLTYEGITYVVLSNVSFERVINDLLGYLNYIIRIIGPERRFADTSDVLKNPLTIYSDLIHRLSLLSIVFTFFIFNLKNSKLSLRLIKGINIYDKKLIVLFSLVLTGIIETFLYSLQGLFPFLRILYFSTVIFVSYLGCRVVVSNKSLYKFLVYAATIIAFVSNVLHFSSYIMDVSHQYHRPYVRVRIATEWLAIHAEEGSVHTFHLQAASLLETIVSRNKADKLLAMSLMTDKPTINPGEYLLLGEFKFVVLRGWDKPVPLQGLKLIEGLRYRSKIFTSNYGEIFRF